MACEIALDIAPQRTGWRTAPADPRGVRKIVRPALPAALRMRHRMALAEARSSRKAAVVAGIATVLRRLTRQAMHKDGPLVRRIEQHAEGAIGELKKAGGPIRL